ncbi:hypothetical protein DL767_011044 [Monosporascus sp. MG133]|nr:hypothetical protein DL767_011044 [Monosporascus sp. MG133]
MQPHQVNTNYYTHIHFAFAGVSENFEVQIDDLQDMFELFETLTSVKRILSFGGWSFSPDQGFDGVDFDSEYPGADILAKPLVATKTDLIIWNLKLVGETALRKTIGIAAPASYWWYLKGFPIAEIAMVVDYIIYMTYDLHGQWDYANRYSTYALLTVL